MRISAINTSFYNLKNNAKFNKTEIKENKTQPLLLSLAPVNVPFGAMLTSHKNTDSLKESVEEFEKKQIQMPAGVEKTAKRLIKNNSAGGRQVYNVHKQVYGDLTDITTLGEAKKRYPEFENVKAVDEIDPKSAKVINGLALNKIGTGIAGERKDEDIVLKLLKMHWVDCTPINEKSFCYVSDDNGKLKHLKYSSVYEELNIPVMDKRYMQVLDNQRYTQWLDKKFHSEEVENATKAN